MNWLKKTKFVIVYKKKKIIILNKNKRTQKYI